MKNGKAPLHLWGRWSPADYLDDEVVRLCAARGNSAARWARAWWLIRWLDGDGQ